MPGGLSIDVDPQPTGGQVLLMLSGAETKIKRAGRYAAGRTASWIRARLPRRIASELKIPLKAARRRVKTRRGTGRYGSASVWVGLNPLGAHSLGRLWPRSRKQQRASRGSWAGEHFFEGAFVASTRSGFRSVFYRKTRKRRPIAESSISMRPAEPLTRQIAAEASQEFTRVYAREIDRRLRLTGTGG